jgi:hypothetical protein
MKTKKHLCIIHQTLGDSPCAACMRDEIAAARSVILRGVEIMSDEQVGKWAGVRTWLEATDSDINPPTSAHGSEAVRRLRNEVAITEAKDSPLARDITLICDQLSDAIDAMCGAYDHLPEGTSKWDFDRIIDKFWGPEQKARIRLAVWEAWKKYGPDLTKMGVSQIRIMPKGSPLPNDGDQV